MNNASVGDGIVQNKFLDVFKRYVSTRMKSKLKPAIMVWDYKLTDDVFENAYKIEYVDMNFVTMRNLQIGNLNTDADILIIDKFCFVPKLVQNKIISNIEQNKYKYMIIFMDEKTNANKLSADTLDKMTHFVVLAPNE